MAQGTAKLEGIRLSPRKAKLVVDLIRNKPIAQAISILESADKKTAPILLKVLHSAIANAVNNHGANAERLYVSEIMANQGPTLKRILTRAKGSADRIRKRSTHLVVTVSDEEK